MRLFTALWLPPCAAEALAAILHGVPEPSGWRFVDPATWHVTLAFHGEAEPEPLARRLDETARGLAAPRLRVAGAGSFAGVRWAGVEPGEALRALVDAAGGDADQFVAHITVLRRRGRPGRGAGPPVPWATHAGPWWSPDAVMLVASEPGAGGARYRPVHRVPLGGVARE